MSTASAAEVGLVVVSECTGVVLSQTLADTVKLQGTQGLARDQWLAAADRFDGIVTSAPASVTIAP